MDKKIHKEVDDGFMTIIKIRSDIKTRIEDIEKIKHSIKQNYIECIEKESKNYFGLDSVHFQNKLIELEFANMLKLYNYIDNRIYGDYYKLFFMMNDYLSDKLLQEQYASIKEMKKKSLYPVYKDLDSFKSYDFDTINNIHQDVISIVKKVYEIHGENEEKIKTRQESLYYGINLDNYIINQQHLNQELLMTNNLHRNYICVYHKLHDNILDNFLEKVELFFEQINNHTIDESPNSTENVFQKNEHDEPITFSDESEENLNNHNFVNDCESLFEIKEIHTATDTDTDKVDNLSNE
tara:strand:+ start:64 stop:948 length:885 start_codon:yes stop_codon:yes gene_type:complete